MPPVESSAYGSRSLNSSVQKRVVRTRTESLTCIRGGGRSMRFKGHCFLYVSLRASGLACIQPPTASGQFRRGIVTMSRIKQKQILFCTHVNKIKRDMQAPPCKILIICSCSKERKERIKQISSISTDHWCRACACVEGTRAFPHQV